MINVNDFKTGMTISYEGNLYQVLEFQHVKPGKGAAIVKTKLKNLRTGSIVEQTFNSGIKIPSAHVEKIKMQYLYESNGMYTFMNMNTYEQVELANTVRHCVICYIIAGLLYIEWRKETFETSNNLYFNKKH